MPKDELVESRFKKEVFVWRASARPFKKRSREFYIKTLGIVAVVCLILFLADGWIPVVLIISLTFLFYVLSTVAPEEIEYKVTNDGVEIAGKKNKWIYFGRYWFTERFGGELLIFETFSIPGRMELVINQQDRDKIRNILSRYLIEEEVPPSYLDRSIGWFSKKLLSNK